MKRLSVLIILIPLVYSCGKKESLSDIQKMLEIWAQSSQDYNYSKYSRCEAFPKEFQVFREIYRDYYYSKVKIINPGKTDQTKQKDHNGHTYITRDIEFVATAVMRKNRSIDYLVKGDVRLIKYLDGNRKNDGWLISNRTLIRMRQ